MKSKIYLLIFSFLISGCSYYLSENYTVLKKKLPRKNPSIYIFNTDIGLLYNKIEAAKYVFSGVGGDLYNSKAVFFENIFELPENKKDFVLTLHNTKSLLYVNQEDSIPLNYYADYHIHLVEIDSARTLVQVVVYNPRVGIGNSPWVLWGDTPKEMGQVVEPSSIEEYEILLKIGELSGEKNMPALLVPY